MKTAAVVAAHNAELHLVECLRSLSDFTDIYLYDDASTDATAAIAKALGATYRSGPANLGVTKAKRKAMEMALESGKSYDAIAVCDSDDIRIVGSLEFQAHHLEQSGADVVVSPARTIGSSAIYAVPHMPVLACWYAIPGGCYLWRAEALRSLLSKTTLLHGDPERQLLIQLWKDGGAIAFDHIPVLHYRENWSAKQQSKQQRNRATRAALRADILAHANPDELKLLEKLNVTTG